MRSPYSQDSLSETSEGRAARLGCIPSRSNEKKPAVATTAGCGIWLYPNQLHQGITATTQRQLKKNVESGVAPPGHLYHSIRGAPTYKGGSEVPVAGSERQQSSRFDQKRAVVANEVDHCKSLLLVCPA